MRTKQQQLVDPSDQLLTQMVAAHGVKVTMNSLATMSGYVQTPPTIREFVDGEDYLKDALWNEDRDESILYPLWRSALTEIYPNPFHSTYREVILTGSIGGGKTTVAKIGLLYDMVKLCCIKSPQAYFGLTKATKLLFALYSNTLTSAKNILFDELYEWMNGSPYLKGQLTPYSNKKYSARTLLQKNIDAREGSRFTHTLGQAIVGGILSELNFQTSWTQQAYGNYTNVKRRMKSRFLNKIPGRMWLDSSKSDKAAFLESHIKKVRRDPNVRVFDNALWEIKTKDYCGKTFKMFMGDNFKDPFIIEKKEQLVGLDETHVLDVPIEHYQDFVDDIYSSLQDIAGRSTSSIHKFLPSVERIEECLIRPNPVTKKVIVLDFYDQEESLIQYIDIRKFVLNKSPRFIHIDLGLRNDKAGIAMSSIRGFVTIERYEPGSLKVLRSKEPIYYTDFVLSLQNKSGQDVPIYKIKYLIKDLAARGIPIGMVTMDGYQSENLKQDLWLLKFESKIMSVDKPRTAYDYLKMVILEGRYNGVQHPILRRELKELLDTGQKIDHPMQAEAEEENITGQERGSKDLADAVCGSVYSAFQNMEKFYGSVDAHDEFIEAVEEQSELNIYEQLFSNRAMQVSVVNHP